MAGKRLRLQCGDCKNRNYTTTKNKKKHSDRLETKKFLQFVQEAHGAQGSEIVPGFRQVFAGRTVFAL